MSFVGKIAKAGAIIDVVDKGLDVLDKGIPVVKKAGDAILDIADKAIDVGDKLIDRVIDIPFKPLRKAQELSNNNLKMN